MKKNPKEAVDLAFKFSDNMIDKIKASIEAGTLEGDALEDAKRTVEDYEAHKKAIYAELEDEGEIKGFCNLKKFSASGTASTEKLDLLAFAILRRVISKLGLDTDYTDALLALKSSLAEIGVSDSVVDSIVHRTSKSGESDPELCKCYNDYLQNLAKDKLNYMQVAKNIDTDLNGVLGAIKDAMTKEGLGSASMVKKFSADGERDPLEIIKSGVGFLKSIVDKMKGAENPDEANIESYETAIQAMSKVIDQAQVKQFSAEQVQDAKVKLFSALELMGCGSKAFTCAMSNAEFVDILQSLGHDYTVTSVSCDENGHDVYTISNGTDIVDLVVDYNIDANTFNSIAINGVEVDLANLEDEVRATLVVTPAPVIEPEPEVEEKPSEVEVTIDPDED